MSGYFISLDLGTSKIKCFAVNTAGEITAKTLHNFLPSYPAPGLAEYNGEEFLKLAVLALDEMFAKTDGKVLAVSIASQRSTIVLWDKKTGKTLAPVMCWHDGRGKEETERADISNEEIYEITGLYKTPYFGAGKISWAIKNVSAVKTALEKGNLAVGGLPSFLIWHLTKGDQFITDPALAQRTLLMDIKSFNWNDKILKAFSIPRSALAEITPTDGNFGQYRNAPILAVLGDQQAAFAGTGLSDSGTLINYGTGTFYLAGTGNEIKREPGMLTDVGWHTKDGRKNYLLEGLINAGSSVLDWLHNLGLDFDRHEADYICARSKNPPMFLPALGGISSPVWDFSVKPAFADLSNNTKKEDIIRAGFEGIAYLANDVREHIKNLRIDRGNIMAAGGLSNCDFLLQFQADLFQEKISRTRETEATAVGTALFSARQAGIDTSKWHCFGEGKVFGPAISADAALQKTARWRTFVKTIRGLGK